MHRLPLPENEWVDLRELKELTVNGKRGITVLAAGLAGVLPKIADAKTDADIIAAGLTEDEMDRFMRLQEATIVAFLAGWSRPDPLPTLASVGGMPAEFYEAISEATAKDAATVAAAATATGRDGGAPDPKASSGGSKNSASPSKGSPPRTRTRKSVKRGTPTPTGS